MLDQIRVEEPVQSILYIYSGRIAIIKKKIRNIVECGTKVWCVQVLEALARHMLTRSRRKSRNRDSCRSLSSNVRTLYHFLAFEPFAFASMLSNP